LTNDTRGNYIGGKWGAASSGETFEQRNPAALSEVTGHYPASSAEDAKRAVDAAAEAVASWRDTPPADRADILSQAHENLEDRKDALAEVLTRENGKTLTESRGEIDYALDDMGFQIGEGLRLYGETVPSSLPGVLSYTVREPVGVAAVISPWNFPVSVPASALASALGAGCPVVFKPASLTAGTGVKFAEMFIDAGIPPGVLNLVLGSGREVGGALVADRRVRAISFTGSTAVGRAIQREAAESFTRTQLELGGQNPVVVLEDADLDTVAAETVAAAFGSAGQKCTATSRVIAVRPIAEELTQRILDRVKAIRVGNGLRDDVHMGPVCGETQLTDILEQIERGRDDGATVLAGGEQLTGDDYDDGCYIAPTVFGNVASDMSIAQEEVFGPVLAVLTVDDFDEALAVANGVRYGLSASVYTSDLERALTFLKQAEAGVTHVNLMTSLSEPQLAFGGFKESGFGIPEAGRSGVRFFTDEKVAYVRYRRLEDSGGG
jgi:aldehyde dehydrogenase (NAD+)